MTNTAEETAANKEDVAPVRTSKRIREKRSASGALKSKDVNSPSRTTAASTHQARYVNESLLKG